MATSQAASGVGNQVARPFTWGGLEMFGVTHKKWKGWLQQLIVGVSLAGALTSCSASSAEVDAQLSAVTERAILNDFLQAIHGPAVALEPGRTVTGELTSTDPVFRIK